MKLNFDNPGEEARIEILPLIDVIFCILTFFILGAVSLTRQSAIGVDLPSAGTGTPQMREMLLVSLDPIGQLYFEQQPVSRKQLSDLLQAEYEANPRKLAVLYASRSAKYDDVVDILDLLRAIGGDRVALATLPEPGEVVEPIDTLPGFDSIDPNFEFSPDGSLGPNLTNPPPGSSNPGLLPGDAGLSPLPSGSSDSSIPILPGLEPLPGSFPNGSSSGVNSGNNSNSNGSSSTGTTIGGGDE